MALNLLKYRHIKRCFDIVVAIAGMTLISPVYIILFLLVGAFHGFPVLFKQTRPGFGGMSFTIYKFRTMNNRRDNLGNLLPDADRLTKFGRFLRCTSLDELPELYNVLKGEMSLVGPRPLRMHYLDRYTSEQFRRHEVKPGITGWAQINGRNVISWEERFRHDVWYVDNLSLWLDLKILVYTIVKVFKREGISADGNATMPPFTGSL